MYAYARRLLYLSCKSSYAANTSRIGCTSYGTYLSMLFSSKRSASGSEAVVLKEHRMALHPPVIIMNIVHRACRASMSHSERVIVSNSTWCTGYLLFESIICMHAPDKHGGVPIAS